MEVVGRRYHQLNLGIGSYLYRLPNTPPDLLSVVSRPTDSIGGSNLVSGGTGILPVIFK
jgi:hypothetical protein